jgi:citrate synthase
MGQDCIRYAKSRAPQFRRLDGHARAVHDAFEQRTIIRYAKKAPLKIGSQKHRATAISASNAETIVVRGRDLVHELMGKISFTDHFWLLLTGSLPSKEQRLMLDSTLVAIAEHGLVPSVQASRMTLAAAPEALQGAVAAGILGCGSVVLGSAEAAGRFYAEIARQADAGASLEESATSVIKTYRADRRAIPGYGHPLHKSSDPRATRLIDIATGAGCAGRYIEIAHLAERLLPGVVGKQLTLNVSGAIPAVLLDVGYPVAALKGIPILAHLLEEQERPIGFVLSHAAGAAIEYDGTAPDGFSPSKE